MNMRFMASFAEAEQRGKAWKIVYIDEGEVAGRGWGIWESGLRASLPVFEHVWVQNFMFQGGRQDHLSADVRAVFPSGVIAGNIVGMASDPQMEQRDGRWAITGWFYPSNQHIQTLLTLARQSGKLAEFGLSVNADVTDDRHLASRTLANGRTIQEVLQFDALYSTDMVTDPGRGGGFLDMLASAGLMNDPDQHTQRGTNMTVKDRLTALLKSKGIAYQDAPAPLQILASAGILAAEGNVTPNGMAEADKKLLEAIRGALEQGLDGLAAKILDSLAAPPKADNNADSEPKQASANPLTASAIAPPTPNSLSAADISALLGLKAERELERILLASHAPESVKQNAREFFANRPIAPTHTEIEHYLTQATKLLASVDTSGHVRQPALLGYSTKDKLQEAVYALLASKTPKDGIPALRGLQDAYIQATGDTYMEAPMGRRGFSAPLLASDGLFQPSDFPYLLGDGMNRAIVDFYGEYEKWWQKVMRYRRGIRDFRSIKINRINAMGLLTKFEDAPASEGIVKAAVPGEAQGTYAIDIYSNKLVFDFKFVRNNDIDALEQFLQGAAFVCYSTVSYYTFAMLINLNLSTGAVNALTTNYTGAAFYSAANKNLLTKRLSYEAAQEAKLMLMSQKQPGDDGRNLRQQAWGLWYAIPLSGVADVIVDSEKAPNSAAENVNTLRGLQKIPVAVEDLADNAKLWGMITNPQQRAVVQGAFLDDVDTPWIMGTSPNQTSGQPWDFLRTEYRAVMMFGVGQESHEAGVLGFPNA